jgi:hypothetical protein
VGIALGCGLRLGEAFGLQWGRRGPRYGYVASTIVSSSEAEVTPSLDGHCSRNGQAPQAPDGGAGGRAATRIAEGCPRGSRRVARTEDRRAARGTQVGAEQANHRVARRHHLSASEPARATARGATGRWLRMARPRVRVHAGRHAAGPLQYQQAAQVAAHGSSYPRIRVTSSAPSSAAQSTWSENRKCRSTLVSGNTKSCTRVSAQRQAFRRHRDKERLGRSTTGRTRGANSDTIDRCP